ncbi:hypothetical protein GCM10027053_41780 [Intrasporangium mesophilum]
MASSASEGPAWVVPVGAGVLTVGSGVFVGVSVGGSLGAVVGEPAGGVGEAVDELVPLGVGAPVVVGLAEPVGWGVPVSENKAGRALPRLGGPEVPLPVPVSPRTGAQAVCCSAIAVSTLRCACRSPLRSIEVPEPPADGREVDPCDPDGVDVELPPGAEEVRPEDCLPVEVFAPELDPLGEEPEPPDPDEEDADEDVEEDVEVELSSASRLASAWARVASASRRVARSAVGSMEARTSPALTR